MEHRTVASRRRFVRTAGAALSATAAAAVTASPLTAAGGDLLQARLARLEDIDAIRRVHFALVASLNDRAWERALDLFDVDAEVHLAGGVFAGRDRGLRRLFVEHFGRSLVEARPGPVHTYLRSHEPHLDAFDVAPDRRSATATHRCVAQVSAAIAPDCTLAEMALQQGEGALRWQETADIEATYVRTGASWTIARLAYRAPAACATFTATYPAHPAGPDRLV